MTTGGLTARIVSSHSLSSDWRKLQESATYDVLMRLPFLAWAFIVATASCAEAIQYIRTGAGLPTVVFAINIVARLSTFAFLVLLAASMIARTRPAARARGLGPRVTALTGTFLLYAACLFPRHDLTPAAEVASTLLILLGTAGATFILRQLGRSFSIMPEARHLVTSGVYRFVRHPLYLAEELAAIGVIIQFLSIWTVILLVVQIVFQIRRMINEEAVLLETFPEYAAYSKRTARLIPCIY